MDNELTFNDFLEGYRNLAQRQVDLEANSKNADELLEKINNEAERLRNVVNQSQNAEEREVSARRLNSLNLAERTDEIIRNQDSINQTAEQNKKDLSQIEKRRNTILKNAENLYKSKKAELEEKINNLSTGRNAVPDPSLRVVLDQAREDLRKLEQEWRNFRRGVIMTNREFNIGKDAQTQNQDGQAENRADANTANQTGNNAQNQSNKTRAGNQDQADSTTTPQTGANGEWGPLTPEEIDDAIQLGFTEYTPGDGESFDRFLIDHGYDPQKLKDEKDKANKNNPKKNNPDPKKDDPDPKIDNPDPKKDDPDPKIDNPDPKKGNPDPKIDDPDPKIVDPNNNLPVVSGLQIYNRVLQEVGKIKGTKLIKWHDMMQHVAIIGRPIAGVMRLLSGRKKEQKRIVKAMEDIDFQKEFGIKADDAMDLMIDDCLLKDGTRSITQLKVNDIFLRALHQKLGKDMQRRRADIEQSDEYKQRQQKMSDLRKERENATPSRVSQIDKELAALNKENTEKYVNPVQKFNDRLDGIEDGRKKKSYEKKENIKGADAAVRDLDSREVISKLAEIERGKLIAEREGRTDDAELYELKMDEYMDEQTQYKKAFLGKGKVSIGAFEKPIGQPKVMSNKDYLYMKIATGIGAASIFSALAFRNQLKKVTDSMEWAEQQQAKVDQAIINQRQKQRLIHRDIAKAQTAVDAQTKQLNQMSGQINAAKGRITGNDADMAVQAVRKPSIESQLAGERASSHAGGFNESTQAYINTDQQNVSFATQQAKNAENYINGNTGKGNSITRFVDALRQKAAGERANSGLIQSSEQSAAAFYSDPSHIISHAGVDHSTVANLESNFQTIANNADIQATETAADVIEMLSKMNASGASKIDLASMIGVPSIDPITIAGYKQGIDWFSVAAPTILGINKAVDDKAKNKEERN